MTLNIQHDLEDDYSGLVAWVDGRGQFFAVGDDNVVREYGNGDERRLRADMQTPATSPVARHVAVARWGDALREYQRAEYCDISHLSDDEKDAACGRAGLALDAVIATRSPDLATLADKMRLVDKTGTYQADGYFEELLLDVDHLAKRAIFLPSKADIFAAFKRTLKKIEPWYDWYQANVFRIDAQCRDFTDESTGDVFRFQLQWLGLHVGFEIGRTPRKLTEAEVADNRQRLAARTSEEQGA
ncbi:hypothetical protein [Novosphingobium resinovorum]|uniref:hypothetical protein n=1 Tax=Novosphingobium resinovorum TaxID=158500 RepID=UPI002ED5F811|nr:hypothetical protein [Novosphingobium resinovorum]